MDSQTGHIYSGDDFLEFKKMLEALGADKERLVEMKQPPTPLQMRRKPPAVKGWERCPCGSGKLFKNCHKRKASG